MALSQSASAASKRDQNAEAFVQNLADHAVGLLSDPSLSSDDKRNGFRKVVENSMDFRRIGLFTLAKYRRQASKPDLAEFESLFREYAINIYESRIGEYAGESLVVTGSTRRNEREVIVRSLGYFADFSEPLAANWRLMKVDGEYLIIDIQVAGVWMAIEQRSQFSAILTQNRGNLSALNNHLRRRLKSVSQANTVVADEAA